MIHTQIIEALKWRYATKIFDQSKKVSESDLHTILESARLAPSSLGVEAWKFLVIENPDIRAKLRAAAYDQPKLTDASHIIVLARRTDAKNIVPELITRTAADQGKDESDLDALRQMVERSITHKITANSFNAWASAQTYIALGIMVETASLLGVDNCPMEGFDSVQVDEILGLSAKNLASVTMCALGYRGQDKYAVLPKTRRDFEEVVEFVK